MNLYDTPQRGLLICATRSGGTMLSHLLDSHPLIFCTRGEAIHRHSNLRALHDEPKGVIRAVLKMQGYRWNIVKLTYEQVHEVYLSDVSEIVPDVIIHLLRRNLLRCAISDAIRKEDKTYRHTYAPLPLQPIEIDANAVYEEVCERDRQQAYFKRYLPQQAPKTVTLWYEDIAEALTNGHWSSWLARDMCAALDVPYFNLYTATVPVNPQSLRELVVNYAALEARFSSTEYEWMMDT